MTGGAGFTGRHVVTALAGAGYRVVGPGIGSGPGSQPADLCDLAAMRALCAATRPARVLHLAARPFVGDADIAGVYAVNVAGTRNLLQALAEGDAPPRHVVLAGSGAVYGTVAADRALAEDRPPLPGNDYAISKLAMEHTARLWSDRLPITVARPFNYTGRGQETKYLIPKIVDHFRRRAARIELGNLEVWRDFGDVRAVAAAYRGLLAGPAAGGPVNISSNTATALRDVLDTCRRLTGHDIAVTVNPAFVRPNEVARLCGDNGRLRRLLPDWRPIPLEETLQWMLDDPAA